MFFTIPNYIASTIPIYIFCTMQIIYFLLFLITYFQVFRITYLCVRFGCRSGLVSLFSCGLISRNNKQKRTVEYQAKPNSNFSTKQNHIISTALNYIFRAIQYLM